MKYNFVLRIYRDENRHPELTDISEIIISDITLISKPFQGGDICLHKGNQKKFKYSIELSKAFDKWAGSHRYPILWFKGDYIDITIKNFPRYPAFYQDKYAARDCLNGWGYTNYINNGFPIQLLRRKIEILNLTFQNI